MTAARIVVAGIAVVLWAGAAAAQERPLRYGSTGGAYFDGRDDPRDFRSNGYFPGNFAADPFSAGFGAAGLFGSTPVRSARPYPSQVVFGAPCRDCGPQKKRRHSARQD
ncbi:BA14K family protein [Bradyrhizobium genosp. L]|uniref:BA14K family protein n=1 Tax=Bradyrhizobium genosp. L TaxID=83637 RepID=UPI0018A2F7DE|nr:BA14K family protein [Bradyrhizobium genosp. L]QPF87836.1 BA14K family protein [Bradyrhizobium genosp. L]